MTIFTKFLKTGGIVGNTVIRSAVGFFMSTTLFIWPMQAQVPAPDAQTEITIPSVQTQIALSSPSYPVTTGDVYSLTYMADGLGPVNYVITVDSSYRIRVSNLGVINVAGKTYQQLRRDVETIVSNNYPLSGVQLVMLMPSAFSVYIKGEVSNATERTTWAMGRLSSLLNGVFSVNSSKRNITVTSADGQVKTYDLFKAQRFGNLKEDPLSEARGRHYH
jgi:hypothetical protein